MSLLMICLKIDQLRNLHPDIHNISQIKYGCGHCEIESGMAGNRSPDGYRFLFEIKKHPANEIHGGNPYQCGNIMECPTRAGIDNSEMSQMSKSKEQTVNYRRFLLTHGSGKATMNDAAEKKFFSYR